MAESKDIARNKKAHFNYEIVEDLEAGIVLTGTEVKSLRGGKANLTDAYATFRGDELFLTNARIEPYEFGNFANHEPDRSRKLLLHKKQILRLKGKTALKGWVIVPLKMYFHHGKVKVLLGVGKGKKLHDKRATIKDRESKRDMERELKSSYR